MEMEELLTLPPSLPLLEWAYSSHRTAPRRGVYAYEPYLYRLRFVVERERVEGGVREVGRKEGILCLRLGWRGGERGV